MSITCRQAKQNGNQGTDKNVYDAGILMGLIIRQRDLGFPADIRTWMRNPEVVPTGGGQGGLDPDLRLLVQRCIAENF
ncbi:hypothetical protein SLS62_001593 [Diatrype stigma]|uniref:Uncharacterized protein n=1 Tax=Diatrype stigma TaxID=117547 RepID=A0AAN9V0L9_9PEZI